jgi:hypothetical protein
MAAPRCYVPILFPSRAASQGVNVDVGRGVLALVPVGKHFLRLRDLLVIGGDYSINSADYQSINAGGFAPKLRLVIDQPDFERVAAFLQPLNPLLGLHLATHSKEIEAGRGLVNPPCFQTETLPISECVFSHAVTDNVSLEDIFRSCGRDKPPRPRALRPLVSCR